jgi:molybdopterin-containing oxidoreductase family membrane subunit
LKVKQTNIGGLYSIALIAFLLGLSCIIYTVSTGIGTWGLNKTVGWAWDITNFVWWVGIGHAGTLLQYFYFSVSVGEWP